MPLVRSRRVRALCLALPALLAGCATGGGIPESEVRMTVRLEKIQGQITQLERQVAESQRGLTEVHTALENLSSQMRELTGVTHMLMMALNRTGLQPGAARPRESASARAAREAAALYQVMLPLHSMDELSAALEVVEATDIEHFFTVNESGRPRIYFGAYISRELADDRRRQLEGLIGRELSAALGRRLSVAGPEAPATARPDRARESAP